MKNPPVPTRGLLLGWFAALGLLTLCTGFLCSLAGPLDLEHNWGAPPWEWPLWTAEIWRLRLFRLLAAALVGPALASAGLALQGLLRNPQAEPYILGISSGAGVGVLAGGALAANWIPAWALTPALALAGGLAATGAVLACARREGGLDPYVLLLAGVMVNVMNGAIILAILQLVRQTDMIHFIGWGMGQIPESLWFRPGLLGAAAALVLPGWVFVFLVSPALNALGLGDDVAESLGVAVKRLRLWTFLAVSIMTAAAVSLAGPVGFVGLIVPHLARLLLGPDHRLLTIACGFGGAIFVMGADTLCRIIGGALKTVELPVGVITALAGGPLFIVLLRRRGERGRR